MRDWPCIRCTDTGVLIDLHVVPGARDTRAMGLHAGALRVRIAAAATDGRANVELLRWLAGQLDVPMRACELLRGRSSRRKQIRVTSVDAEAVRQWLDRRSADWARAGADDPSE